MARQKRMEFYCPIIIPPCYHFPAKCYINPGPGVEIYPSLEGLATIIKITNLNFNTMLKLLKLGSAVVAIYLIATKTMAVIKLGDPLMALLPQYLIAGWLLSSLFLPKSAPKRLHSGWAIAFGYFFVALSDNLTFPEALLFVQIHFAIVTIISFACLLISYSIFETSRGHDPDQPVLISAEKLKSIGILFGGLLILAQLFGLWDDNRHLLFLIPYLLLAAGLLAAGFFYPSRPKLLLVGFGMALGFFASDFYGLVRYNYAEYHALILVIVAMVVSLLGIFLLYRNMELQYKFKPSAHHSGG